MFGIFKSLATSLKMTLIEARVSLATLYFKAKGSFKILIVVLYVNDLIFFIGNDEKMIEK